MPKMPKKQRRKYIPVKKIRIKCKECGNEFLGTKNRIFCSKWCFQLDRNRKSQKKYIPKILKYYQKTCQYCNKKYTTHNKIKQKYCSKECGSQAQKRRLKSAIYGRIDITNPSYTFLKIRFEIFKRDKFRCQYCGRNPREDKCKLVIDHIIPKARGGEDKVDNLITSCKECNLGKRDFLLEVKQLIKNQTIKSINTSK